MANKFFSLSIGKPRGESEGMRPDNDYRQPTNGNGFKMAASSKNAKTLVAMDIGSQKAKYVIGRLRGNKVSVREAFSTPMPEGACYDGKLVRKEDAQGAVFNAIKEYHVAIKETVCTLDSTEIIQRELIVPRVSPDEVLSMASYEIGQYLPIDISSYALQYKKLEDVQTDKGVHMRILVAAMPKSIPKEYSTMLNNIGLKPESLDLNSNSIEKLIQLEGIGDPSFARKNVVVIDMGHSLSNVMFFKAGRYTFNKIIEVGGYMIDDIIIRNLDVRAADAERTKIHNLSRISVLDLYKVYGDSVNSYSDSDNSQEIILKETMGVIETWAKEIDNVLKFYTSRDVTNAIDELLLYGGGSFIKDMDRFLEKSLLVPTRRLSNLNCIELDPRIGAENIPHYLNAIGALIRK